MLILVFATFSIRSNSRATPCDAEVSRRISSRANFDAWLKRLGRLLLRTKCNSQAVSYDSAPQGWTAQSLHRRDRRQTHAQRARSPEKFRLLRRRASPFVKQSG